VINLSRQLEDAKSGYAKARDQLRLDHETLEGLQATAKRREADLFAAKDAVQVEKRRAVEQQRRSDQALAAIQRSMQVCD
jgi:hypothetical protein